MREQRWFLLMMAVVAIVPLVTAGAADAAVISVNMDNYDNNVAPLASDDIAGLEEVANWNAFDPGDGFTVGTADIVDNSGDLIGGGFDVVRTSGGGGNSWNTGGTSNRNMFGDFSNGGVLTISNVPYAEYDLIVYSKLWNSEPQEFDIGGDVQTIINDVGGMGVENPQSFDDPSWSDGVFAEGVHYARFSGLTDSTLVLTHDSMSSFQIVEIPLPLLTSIASANWGVASTWTPNQIPTSGVALTVDGETVTVNGLNDVGGSLQITSGAVNINASKKLTIGGKVDIAGGSLNIAANGTLEAGKIKTTGLGVVANSVLTVNQMLTVDSNFDVTGVTLDIASADTILAAGGTLTNSGDLTMGSLTVNGGSLAMGSGNTLSVTSINVKSDLNMGANSLAVSGTLSADGGLLTVGNAVTPDVVALRNGGDVALAAGGSVVASSQYLMANTTTGLDMTGSADMIVEAGVVNLTGNNDFTGKMQINKKSTLQFSDSAANLGDGHVEFNSNDDWAAPAALQGSGTLNMKIGTGTVESDGTRYVNWAGRGGFAAVDGPLTVNIARGDGTAAPLDWGSSTEGFNNQNLQLGSETANDVMTLTSDIVLGGYRHIFTADNPDSVNDVSAISGNISESDVNQGLEKHKPGTLWLSGDNNTYTGVTMVKDGEEWRGPSVLRAVGAASGTFNLPSESLLRFQWGQLESSGTLTRTIGEDAGQIYWNAGGGFAAYGSNLTVSLARNDGGTGALNWGDRLNGFNGQQLYVGSPTANAAAILNNAIDGDGSTRRVRAINNPESNNDSFVFAGALTNFDGFEVGGWWQNENLYHGVAAIGPTGSLQANWVRVFDRGDFRVDGTVNVSGEFKVEGRSILSGSGNIHVAAGNRAWVRDWGTLAPGSGDVGTLTVHGDGAGSGEFELDWNQTYEWEVGAGDSDTLAVVGGYLDVNDFYLTILDANGYASAADKLDLFTWDADSVLEMDGLPGYNAGTGQLENITFASGRIDINNLDSGIWADVYANPDGLGVYMEQFSNGSGHIYLTGLVGGSTALQWDGGVGNWADAMWGGAAPTADQDMVINADTDDSVVTVAADFITGGTGPAKSVFVGEEYAGKLVVASGNTLEVTGETAAGEFGKIAIENGATLQTGTAVIEIDGRLIAGVQGSDKGLLDSAGQLTIEDADAIQVDWMPGTDAGSMFGGTYTIAQYSGTALATTGTTANEDANIGAAYIKSVDYAADLGGGVLGVNVELHAQGLGDTDLDGDVDGDDLATFGLAWAPSGTDKTWFDGDFDFDGDIDGDDLAALGLAWAPSGISFPAGDLQVTAVPEPGTIAMLLIGMAGLLIYRKRR